MRAFVVILFMLSCVASYADGIEWGMAEPGEWSVSEWSEHEELVKALKNSRWIAEKRGHADPGNCKAIAFYNATTEEINVVADVTLTVDPGESTMACVSPRHASRMPTSATLSGSKSGKTFRIENFMRKVTRGEYGVLIGR